MSKYAEYTTEFRDPKHLCAALVDAGFTPEICTEGATLYGYQGDARPEKAHIIIRRNQIGSAANDVGFQRQADGTYKAIISQYDRGRFGEAWMSRLKQSYQEHRTIAVAKQKGYVFRGREVTQTQKGQQVRLLFAVR